MILHTVRSAEESCKVEPVPVIYAVHEFLEIHVLRAQRAYHLAVFKHYANVFGILSFYSLHAGRYLTEFVEKHHTVSVVKQ